MERYEYEKEVFALKRKLISLKATLIVFSKQIGRFIIMCV